MLNVFDRPNPFSMSMRAMRCPEDMGSITIDGYQLEPDEEHNVLVPEIMVKRLEPHGLRQLTSAETAKLKAGSTSAKK
jgi:hypothetical protein